MALEGNYFQLVFSNGSEVFIKDASLKIEDILQKLSEGTFKGEFFAIKQINTERERQPIYYKRTTVMSIERVSSEMLNNNNKIWSIIK